MKPLSALLLALAFMLPTAKEAEAQVYQPVQYYHIYDPVTVPVRTGFGVFRPRWGYIPSYRYRGIGFYPNVNNPNPLGMPY